MKRHFLTTLLVSIMILSSTTSCVSTVEHIFDDSANKNTTGVLCIGMEKSRKFGACVGSELDATRIYNLLAKTYSNKATLLLNGQATKNIVIEKMQKVCEEDLAIIYYSGHGGDQKQSSFTKELFVEPTGKDQFLCLDDNAMLDDEIWAIVSHAKGRVVLIFDCCHSKTLYRTAFNFDKNFEADSLLFGSSEKEPRILVISGCPDNLFSYGDNNGGIMTNAFLRHFKEKHTYSDMVRMLQYDSTVKAYEAVQFTEIGKSFKDYLIFR